MLSAIRLRVRLASGLGKTLALALSGPSRRVTVPLEARGSWHCKLHDYVNHEWPPGWACQAAQAESESLARALARVTSHHCGTVAGRAAYLSPSHWPGHWHESRVIIVALLLAGRHTAGVTRQNHATGIGRLPVTVTCASD